MEVRCAHATDEEVLLRPALGYRAGIGNQPEDFVGRLHPQLLQFVTGKGIDGNGYVLQ